VTDFTEGTVFFVSRTKEQSPNFKKVRG